MAATIESITTRKRVRLTIRGVVQGIGFRPFVFRLARQLAVGGWIANTAQGVVLEIEGGVSTLEQFQSALKTQAPPVAQIQEMVSHPIPEEGERDFTIRRSTHDGLTQSVIPPDLATCEACLQEINDPRSRRLSISLHDVHTVRSEIQYRLGPSLRSSQHDHGNIPSL